MINAVTTTVRPEIHRERCLNLRQGSVNCQICIKACPHHAIVIHNLAIHINASLCDGCGFCSIDCPTETFEQADFSAMSLLELAQGRQQLELHCRMTRQPTDRPRAINIVCLGLLDTRLMIALGCAGIKEIKLDGLQQCSLCPTRIGHLRLSHTLLETKSVLKRYFPNISSDLAEIQLRMTENQQRRSTPAPAAGRRTFLESIFRSSSQLAAYAALQVLPPGIHSKKQHSKNIAVLSKKNYEQKHVPQHLQLALFNLQSMLEHNPHHLDDLSWLTRIQVSGQCSACGSCAIVCPSGAITIGYQEQYWLIRFQTAHCIGCNLCVTVCPEKALVQTKAADDSALTPHRTTTLFECQELICQGCGKPYICSDEPTELCPACHHDQTIETDLFGTAEFIRITKPGRNL